MTPIKILSDALEQRNQELLLYQINIDNYDLAISKINTKHADNSDLIAFRDELQLRLDEERRQQLRSRIIRDVIADQVEQLSKIDK